MIAISLPFVSISLLIVNSQTSQENSAALQCNGAILGDFGHMSDMTTPSNVCTTTLKGNDSYSTILDCPSKTMEYFENDSCDGDALNVTTIDNMTCGQQDCDYMMLSAYNNTDCDDDSLYMEAAFVTGNTSLGGPLVEFYCDSSTVMMRQGDTAVEFKWFQGLTTDLCFDAVCYTAALPTPSPTACIDYDDNYNSNDGTDETFDESLQSIPLSSDYSNILNQSVIVYDSNWTLYESADSFFLCNELVADFCFIECDLESLCDGTTVAPPQGVILQELIITCTESESCKEMEIDITNSNNLEVESVLIFCTESKSCDSMTVYVSSSSSSTLTVHCSDTQSCNEMVINLNGKQNKKSFDSLTVDVWCYDDNSCDGLIITTDHSKTIEITLNVMRWSEAISIHHLYAQNVNVHCGSTRDRLYIEYATSSLLDDDELLHIARDEYSSNRLPCEDITIHCSNNTDFDHHCIFEYALDIDLESIFNDEHTPDCYWMDIGDVYHADCQGTCGDAMSYNEYPISFDLDIVFEGDYWSNHSNQTLSFLICDEYFGTINDTVSSLMSIDVLFEYALTLITKHGDIIHSVSWGPESFLRGEFEEVKCENTDVNVIQITTNLTIKSHQDNEQEIERLFDEDGVFMNASSKLLGDFFGIPVTVHSPIDFINLFEGFTDLEFGLLGGGIFVFCALIMLLSLYIRHRILESKTIYIRNAMVISIGIGEYDLSMKHRDYRFILSDLSDGIRNDIKSVIQYFQNTLKYKVYPRCNIEDKSTFKVRWTREEVLQFLNKMAKKLEQNLKTGKRPHDGLIVIMSCHGMKNGIYTTDYQTITKRSIHRIFSSLPINRTIPRIFVFDSCAGNQHRNKNTRSDIEHNRLQNGMESHVERVMSNSGSIQREETRLENMDHVMQSRDEENPDYQLVQIDAANPDFEAKMNAKLQESYLTRLLIKGLNLHSNWFLFQIMGEVQRLLYDRGVQLIEHRYNNGTEYIKFVVDESAEIDDSLTSPMIQNGGEETPSLLIEGQTVDFNVRKRNDLMLKPPTQSVGDGSDSVSLKDIEGDSREDIETNDDWKCNENEIEFPAPSAMIELEPCSDIQCDVESEKKNEREREEEEIRDPAPNVRANKVSAKVAKYHMLGLLQQDSFLNDPNFQQMTGQIVEERNKKQRE